MFRTIAIVAGVIFAIGGPALAGPQCGGPDSVFCVHHTYCAKAIGACGKLTALGTCEKLPRFCPEIYRPVCGCDNHTYGNSCEAARAGANISHNGACLRRTLSPIPGEIVQPPQHTHPPGIPPEQRQTH